MQCKSLILMTELKKCDHFSSVNWMTVNSILRSDAFASWIGFRLWIEFWAKKTDDHRINQAYEGNSAHNMSHKSSWLQLLSSFTVLCLCCFLWEAKLEKAGPQYIPVPASRDIHKCSCNVHISLLFLHFYVLTATAILAVIYVIDADFHLLSSL